MTRFFSVVLCLAASISTASAFAQADDQTESSPKPVTYVYVTRPTHIDGFSEAVLRFMNGHLKQKMTAVQGQ